MIEEEAAQDGKLTRRECIESGTSTLPKASK